jgi:NADPH:quinone reductase-like Zn-dependent oxidoreductase
LCATNGPPDVVRVEDVPAPELTAEGVRVRVASASVNFPDVLLVAGTYQLDVPPPFIPGSEFAGVVTEVGSGVEHVAVGDRVSGACLYGAFAEEVVVPALAVTSLAPGIDDRTAAAFGVAHRTAFHVLRSVARVRPGERLVVLGGGSGVGLAAVQIGQVLGAEVTAIASTDDKRRAALDNGAAHTIDRRAGNVREALRDIHPDGFDVVVDPVGGDLSEAALRSLRWAGRFVTVGYASGEIPRIPLNLVLLKGVHVLGFQFSDFAVHEPDALRANEQELRALFESGRVVPHIGAVYSLDDVADALREVAEGRAVGKVVVDVAPPLTAPPTPRTGR